MTYVTLSHIDATLTRDYVLFQIARGRLPDFPTFKLKPFTKHSICFDVFPCIYKNVFPGDGVGRNELGGESRRNLGGGGGKGV